MTLEGPDQHITLRRAAELAGLSYPTLKAQSKPRKDAPARLRVERLGPRTVLTTRRWLHEYLMNRDETNTHAAKLPEGYRVPAGAAPGAVRIVIRPREEVQENVPPGTYRPTDRYGPDGEPVSGRAGKKLGYPTPAQATPGRGREKLSRPGDGPDVVGTGQHVPGMVSIPVRPYVPPENPPPAPAGFQTRTRSSFPVTYAPAQEGKPDDPPAVEG